MMHAEKDWGDVQPEDNAVDDITGARDSGPEEAVVVEYTVVDDSSGPAGNAAMPTEPELAREREQLDPRVRAGEDISTEDLRQGLRRYRSLVQRLLAA
jgi:hypothetical protein